MTNAFVSGDRHRRADGVAAAAVAACAVLLCGLCVVNGDAAACVGVLLVFGMALVAVVCDRPGLRPPSPPRPRGRPRRQAAHLTCVSAR